MLKENPAGLGIPDHLVRPVSRQAAVPRPIAERIAAENRPHHRRSCVFASACFIERGVEPATERLDAFRKALVRGGAQFRPPQIVKDVRAGAEVIAMPCCHPSRTPRFAPRAPQDEVGVWTAAEKLQTLS